jgi:hypothetical protein
MVKRTVQRFKSPLEALGLPKLPDLPNPEEIKEKLGKLDEVVEAAKEIPSTLVSRFSEANGVFKEAQVSFGKTRIPKK